MTPLDAVAAAIRERLISGRPAPLPGLGTLVRQHVPSRVEERADGARVLLPPGETIGLDSNAAGEESLAVAFARFRSLSPDVAERAYAQAMDQIEARLAATGEVRLPGVGLLRRTSGGVVLGVEADLLAAVNRTYEGLSPVQTDRTARPDTPLTAARAAFPPPFAPQEPDPAADAPEERLPEEPTAPAPAAPDAPVRDLSSAGPSSPFAPPAEADLEPDLPANWQPPTIEVVPPSEDEPSPTWPAAAESRPEWVDEPSTQPEETPPPAESAAEDPPEAPVEGPLDASFVDSDTLDADLDDVLAVPFGEAPRPAPSDVFPPTPPAHEPPPEAPPSLPADADDDWSADTWTAPAFNVSDTPLGAPDLDYGGIHDVEPAFEDADFDVVEPEFTWEPEPADEPPPAVPPPGPPPEVERVGPDAEFDVLGPPSAAPSVPFAPGAQAPATPIPPPVAALSGPAPGDAPEPDGSAPTRRRGWGWIVLVLLLALAAAAVYWFWEEIEPTYDRFRSSPGETYSASSEPGLPSATVAEAPLTPLPDSVLRVGEARPVTTPDERPSDGLLEAEARPAVAEGEAPRATQSPGGVQSVRPTAGSAPPTPTQPSLGRAPADGIAILPPRVSGLAQADVESLADAGATVDPGAAAWTLVVLSTPSRAEAEQLRDRYRRAGYRTAVLTASAGGRAMYRVAIGQFATRDDAVRLRSRLPPQAPDDTWALDLRTL